MAATGSRRGRRSINSATRPMSRSSRGSKNNRSHRSRERLVWGGELARHSAAPFSSGEHRRARRAGRIIVVGTGIDRYQIAARMERLPLSRWHNKMRLIVGSANFSDAFDALTVAYV